MIAVASLNHVVAAAAASGSRFPGVCAVPPVLAVANVLTRINTPPAAAIRAPPYIWSRKHVRWFAIVNARSIVFSVPADALELVDRWTS